MLEHVWRRVVACDQFARVAVATDDAEVAAVARAFGAEVLVTGPAPSGTARVALAVGDADVAVVNVQADQPLVPADHLRALVRRLAAGAQVATLCAPLAGDPRDPARVKVLARAGHAVSFSRTPFGPPHRLHVGLYGFAAGQIGRCASAPWSARARAEDLEQLAWMDDGVGIDVEEVDAATLSVDTPLDLERVRAEWVGG